MSNKLLVIGESGSGKSTSLINMPAESTALINVVNKDLPFGGWKKKFTPYDKVSNAGNLFVPSTDKENSTAPQILRAMELCKTRQDIKYVIIDDFQYLMSYEFMKRAKERGYDKFTEIGQNAFHVIQKGETLRDDQVVIYLAHSEEIYQESGRRTKMKTIGKMLDEKITVEGLFTIVLLSEIEKAVEGLKYWFITNSDGSSTAKSPLGMFPEKIPNDLYLALQRIEQFNNE